uniref:Uncharacterized protein n=1 Tax=Parascaris equorum TaxID=6256 RepID=A0A914RZ61_PAREQ
MQQRVFSSKSDVWAYGVMASKSVQLIFRMEKKANGVDGGRVYEIYADGGEPYPGISEDENNATRIRRSSSG